jgi:hypothetical protein
MTDDPTLSQPPTEGGSTNPILERIPNELHGFQGEIRRDLARSRAVEREELSPEAKDLNERMAALEQRAVVAIARTGASTCAIPMARRR